MQQGSCLFPPVVEGYSKAVLVLLIPARQSFLSLSLFVLWLLWVFLSLETEVLSFPTEASGPVV